MKSLGAAILGDEMYGSSSSSNNRGGSNNTAAAAGGAGPLAAAASGVCPDRMYLHAAAIRLQLPGGDWFQVVDPPSEGDLFIHPAVVEACQQLLPLSLTDEFGPWFGDSKLLASNTSL